MVAIKSIGKIVSSLAKTEKTTLAQSDKAVFDFFKKMSTIRIMLALNQYEC